MKNAIFKNAKVRNKKLIIIFTVLIFFIFSSIFAILKYRKIDIERNSNRFALEESESRLVNLEKTLLQKEVKRLISDIFIIKEIVEKDINSDSQDFSNSEDELVSIVKNKRIYDQIRYLDESGMEVIRVDLEDDKTITYSGDDLQDKSDRYYFTDTMKISPEQVYISKLDLNMENGQIEQPLKPMIRISVKIFDKDGKEKGVVISNYYAKIMIKDFKNISETSFGSVYLLNYDSYWISNQKNKDSEFAFMYDDKKDINFKNSYPKVWEELTKGDLSIYRDNNNIFFSEEVIPFDESKDDIFIFPVKNIILGEGDWRIISHVSKEDNPQIFVKNIFEALPQIVDKFKFDFILILIISLFISILIDFYRAHNTDLKFFSERDQMTGVFNRRAGIEKSEYILKKSRERKTDVCIFFIDVNGLKSVNDILGHKFGDELIKSVADIITSVIRKNDVLFRYGGDEFIICFEKMNFEQAEMFWDRISEKTNEENSKNNRKYNVSLSHGASIISGDEENVDLKKYIDEADEKMYQEKIEVKKTAIIIK